MAIVHFVNYKRGTQSRAAMRGVMLYVMQEKKTAWEGGPLVSGINCQPQSVYDDFIIRSQSAFVGLASGGGVCTGSAVCWELRCLSSCRDNLCSDSEFTFHGLPAILFFV